MTDTVARCYPDDPPRFLARTPHGYHDVATIASDLRAAGFEAFEIHTVSDVSHAETSRQPAVAYCQGTPLRNELDGREAGSVEDITRQAVGDIERRFGTGRVSGRMQGHVVVATK